MTTLFPSLGDIELQPYEAPFGRMMLAYGRAIAATIALVAFKVGEAEAIRSVTGTKDLPKRVRRILRGSLSSEQLDKLNAAMNQLKSFAAKRHQLIHGEWWFNVFEDGHLSIRSARRRPSTESLLKKIIVFLGLAKDNRELAIEHLTTVTAVDLDQWAQDLNGISDILDDIEVQLHYQKRSEELANPG